MPDLYSHAEANTRRTWLYLAGFLAAVIGLGWIASWFLQSQAILWIAVVLSIAMSVSSYWYSDKLVVALAHAKEVDKARAPELYRIVENLAIAAGLPTPRVYVISSAQLNAFATGRNPEHAVVAVTTGLLERLERAELEGVLSHELSHIGNRDMLLATAVVALVGVVVLVADFFFRMALWGGGSHDRGGGQARLLMIGIALVFLIAAPVFAQAMKMAISRKREFLADASGALLTRYPEGLARALEKIADDTHELKGANDATSHLYIANPFKGKERKNWAHKLFSSHPPAEERIAALRGMAL